MSIKIIYRGRIGNTIFQYVFARLLAEKNGFFLETGFPYQKILRTTEHKKGKFFSSPIKVIADLPPYNTEYLQDYKIDQILNQKLDDCKYIIDGFFENSELYYEYEDLIKSFFVPVEFEKNMTDIALCLRLGDFSELKKILHPDYYLSVLEEEVFDKIYIIGSEEGEPYLDVFKKYNTIVIPTNSEKDFPFIRQFNKIICSNSTYCWWAAFLSEAEHIYIADKWLSPLIRTCKNAKIVQASILQSYNPKTWYKSVFLKGFRDLADELLQEFIIKDDTIISSLIKDFIDIICKCQKKQAAEQKFTTLFKIKDSGTYKIPAGGSATPAAGESVAPEKADCIFMLDCLTFIESIKNLNYFIRSLKDGVIKSSGNYEKFLSSLDIVQLKSEIDRFTNSPRWLKCKPKFIKIENPLESMVKFLNAGFSVGWFRESTEFGPEGYGNLYWLTGPQSKAKLSTTDYSTCEFFVLAGDLDEYFHPGKSAVGTGEELRLLDEWKDKFFPPGFNKDSFKVRIVTGDSDNEFLNILKEFKKQSGVFLILNLSPGREGQPAVETAEQALNCFYDSKMDYMVLSDFLVYKN